MRNEVVLFDAGEMTGSVFGLDKENRPPWVWKPSLHNWLVMAPSITAIDQHRSQSSALHDVDLQCLPGHQSARHFVCFPSALLGNVAQYHGTGSFAMEQDVAFGSYQALIERGPPLAQQPTFSALLEVSCQWQCVFI